MNRKTGLVCVLLVLAVGWQVFARPCEAAEVKDLIAILATPEPPAQRPPDVNPDDWATKRDEIWQEKLSAARSQLTQAGAAAVTPLMGLIGKTQDDSVRVDALTVLSSMGDSVDLKPAGPGLVALLSDKNPAVRYLAAKTLGRMKYRPALPELLKLADDAEFVERMIAADALGEMGDPRAVPALAALASDKQKSVRLHAIEALGTLGIALAPGPKPGQVTDAVKVLIDKLQIKDDVNERNTATRAILDMLGYDLNADGRYGIAVDRGPFLRALEAWWQAALDRKGFVLDSPEVTLRVNIANWKVTEAERQKGIVVTDAERVKAIETLVKVGDLRAVDYLSILLTEANRVIRQATADAVSALSGIQLEYVPTDTESVWLRKVEDWRRAWRESPRRPVQGVPGPLGPCGWAGS